YKYQFGKLIKAAKKAKNKDIGYMTKYEDLMDQMMNKTKTEIQENSYDKFNILTNYFKKKSHNNQDLVYLADFVCEINELIRYKVLQLKDIYASRMYYQLKATIESRKFSEKEIKLFGY
ncbi:hypothetical protein KAJ27_20420, partial [bacterium]|nr:hypothetical protein [bacterium]